LFLANLVRVIPVNPIMLIDATRHTIAHDVAHDVAPDHLSRAADNQVAEVRVIKTSGESRS
jgi:hypothetical protein